MNFDLVFHNGTLITSSDTFQADLGVRSGKIEDVGYGFTSENMVDATGLYIIPGGIDPHVHLEMPLLTTISSDDWYTGTLAAAFGGTTTVIDFVEPSPDESLLQALESRRILAEGRAVIDFSLHMTLDRANNQTLTEISEVVNLGVTSFKCYTTYDMKLDDKQLLIILDIVGENNGLVIVHAENDAMINYLQRKYLQAGNIEPRFHPLSRPSISEGEAIERVLALASIAKSPVYIVHVSTKYGAEAIERARDRGQIVFGETCPQYLILTDNLYNLPGFEGAKYVCSPPLRKSTDQDSLWNAMNWGYIQSVGTDHCPFFYEGDKDLGRKPENLPSFTEIPGGIPSIEARLSLLYSFGVRTGKITLNKWVELFSTGPARIFDLYPKKGSLAPGADADIVLFDPNKNVILSTDLLHERVDYTPYEGLELTGYPVQTYLRGKLLTKDGETITQSPSGKYIPRGI